MRRVLARKGRRDAISSVTICSPMPVSMFITLMLLCRPQAAAVTGSTYAVWGVDVHRAQSSVGPHGGEGEPGKDLTTDSAQEESLSTASLS